MGAPRTELPARPACLPKTWLKLAEVSKSDVRTLETTRGWLSPVASNDMGIICPASMFTLYTVEGVERVRVG